MSLNPYILKGYIKRALGIFGHVVGSVATGLVASTTHTIAGGTPLTAMVNVVATTANANDAVTLRAMQVGEWQDVYNNGANTLAVYPSASTVAIDAGSVGAAASLATTHRCRYTQVSATLVISSLLGAVSA